MVMKSLIAEIVDGRLVLPEEALALLPPGTPLRVITDSEKGTVCIYAKESPVLSTQYREMVSALDELNDGLTQEEYFKPVPEDQLRRPRQDDEGKSK